jgi:ParB family chromosome partitioning protein
MTPQNKRRLGRGLEALLGPPSTEQALLAGDLQQIPLDLIRPNPFQPREAFDDEAIADLAKSLHTAGLLQPIVLRPAEGGTFELIAGERRWRAARQLGWERIGAVIRDVDDRTLLTLALVENLQRDALSPIDEAKAYRRLVEDFSATQSEVAELVGRDRSTVANSLRLLKLPHNVQQMVHRGELDMGHARALLQVEERGQIERLARAAVEQGWSVRETEERARGNKPPSKRPRSKKGARRASAEARRVEDALRRYLGTDVSLTERRAGKGRLSISFYSNDDLARILELVMGAPFDG